MVRSKVKSKGDGVMSYGKSYDDRPSSALHADVAALRGQSGEAKRGLDERGALGVGMARNQQEWDALSKIREMLGDDMIECKMTEEMVVT